MLDTASSKGYISFPRSSSPLQSSQPSSHHDPFPFPFPFLFPFPLATDTQPPPLPPPPPPRPRSLLFALLSSTSMTNESYHPVEMASSYRGEDAFDLSPQSTNTAYKPDAEVEPGLTRRNSDVYMPLRVHKRVVRGRVNAHGAIIFDFTLR